MSLAEHELRAAGLRFDWSSDADRARCVRVCVWSVDEAGAKGAAAWLN